MLPGLTQFKRKRQIESWSKYLICNIIPWFIGGSSLTLKSCNRNSNGSCSMDVHEKKCVPDSTSCLLSFLNTAEFSENLRAIFDLDNYRHEITLICNTVMCGGLLQLLLKGGENGYLCLLWNLNWQWPKFYKSKRFLQGILTKNRSHKFIQCY